MFAHWWYSNSYLVHLGQSGKNVLIFAQQKQTNKKNISFLFNCLLYCISVLYFTDSTVVIILPLFWGNK